MTFKEEEEIWYDDETFGGEEDEEQQEEEQEEVKEEEATAELAHVGTPPKPASSRSRNTAQPASSRARTVSREAGAPRVTASRNSHELTSRRDTSRREAPTPPPPPPRVEKERPSKAKERGGVGKPGAALIPEPDVFRRPESRGSMGGKQPIASSSERRRMAEEYADRKTYEAREMKEVGGVWKGAGGRRDLDGHLTSVDPRSRDEGAGGKRTEPWRTSGGDRGLDSRREHTDWGDREEELPDGSRERSRETQWRVGGRGAEFAGSSSLGSSSLGTSSCRYADDGDTPRHTIRMAQGMAGGSNRGYRARAKQAVQSSQEPRASATLIQAVFRVRLARRVAQQRNHAVLTIQMCCRRKALHKMRLAAMFSKPAPLRKRGYNRPTDPNGGPGWCSIKVSEPPAPGSVKRPVSMHGARAHPIHNFLSPRGYQLLRPIAPRSDVGRSKPPVEPPEGIITSPWPTPPQGEGGYERRTVRGYADAHIHLSSQKLTGSAPGVCVQSSGGSAAMWEAGGSHYRPPSSHGPVLPSTAQRLLPSPPRVYDAPVPPRVYEPRGSPRELTISHVNRREPSAMHASSPSGRAVGGGRIGFKVQAGASPRGPPEMPPPSFLRPVWPELESQRQSTPRLGVRRGTMFERPSPPDVHFFVVAPMPEPRRVDDRPRPSTPPPTPQPPLSTRAPPNTPAGPRPRAPPNTPPTSARPRRLHTLDIEME